MHQYIINPLAEMECGIGNIKWVDKKIDKSL